MRGETTIVSADGFRLGGWRSDPSGKPLGSVVVIHEIFGITAHIRSVCDRYAAMGFTALAPGLFDRQERRVDLAYDDAGRERGRALMRGADIGKAIQDVAATVAAVGDQRKVAVLGYCWGGTMAWLAAARVEGLSAAVCYYGPGIAKHLEESPSCPVMLHFGEKDEMIPEADRSRIQEAYPHVDMWLYPAAHGFNCDERGSWDETSAKLAFERTLEFLNSSLSAH